MSANTKINIIYLSTIQKAKSNNHIRFVPYFYNHKWNLCITSLWNF